MPTPVIVQTNNEVVTGPGNTAVLVESGQALVVHTQNRIVAPVIVEPRREVAVFRDTKEVLIDVGETLVVHVPRQGPPGTPGRASAGALALPTATTIDININYVQDVFSILLTGPTTINFVNGSESVDGKRIMLRLKQDAVGSHVVTWGPSVAFSNDIPDFFLTTQPLKKDYVGFVYDHETGKVDLLTFNRGFDRP